MSEFPIPNENKQIRQVNQGDTFGEIWASFGIDLTTKPGKIQAAKRMIKILDENEDLGNDETTSIAIYNGNYYLVTSGTGYTCALTDDPTDASNWSEETDLSGALSFYGDTVVFNNKLLLSKSDDIDEYDGASNDSDWWTGTISGTQLQGNKPHMLHVFKGGAETLFVTDDSNVRYYNATAGHSTVALATDLTSCCITSGVDAIWVGTYTETGERAYVYQLFVGQTTQNGTPVSNRAFPINARAVLAMEIVDNIPYIVTETGEIQKFNGAGFTTVAYFPFAFSKEKLEGAIAGRIIDPNKSRPVHPNGIQAHLRSIYILINTQDTNGNKANYRSPSGIWEYNLDTGNLNHRSTFANESTDYGSHVLSDSGPLFIADVPETFFMAGCSTTSLTDNGFYVEGTTGLSTFVTPEIETETIQEAFGKVHQMAKTLADGERIVLKYRTSKNPNYPLTIDINWTSATTFTTTDSNFATVTIGDKIGAEIEIQEGYRSGYVAQITKIEGSGTYTVTVDESIGLGGEESTVMIENWVKIPSEYTDEDGEYKSIGVDETNPWAQFKVCLYGDIEYRKFISKGNAKTKKG